MSENVLPNGHFYYFLRTPGPRVGPVALGHMGWGFETAVELRTCAPDAGSSFSSRPVMGAPQTYTRQWYFGSLENTGGSGAVGSGGDNDYWTWAVDTEAQMLEEMRTMQTAARLCRLDHLDGYTAYKKIPVVNARATEAEQRAWEWSGYLVIGNNCLDNAAKIGEEYGVPVWSGAGRFFNISPINYFNNVLHQYPSIPLSLGNSSIAATAAPGG